MARVRIRRVTLGQDQRCPLCREPVGDEALGALAVCPGCDAVHHEDCVDELGGGRCAAAGCGRSLQETVIPAGEEAGDGERTLLVGDSFLLDTLALFGTGLAVFFGLMAGVAAVIALRWPIWTMALGSVLPLCVYLLFSALRSPRARRRRRARRRKGGKG